MAEQEEKAAIRKKKSNTKHNLKQKEDTVKNTSAKSSKHYLDPKDASDYLTSWKHDRETWKFKKNIQSWLLRHIYDWEKVSKNTFSLLLEYMGTIEGSVTRERIMKDAMDVVQRYKEWEKDSDRDKEDDENESKSLKETENNENNCNIQNWNKLSSHDKRKQYKRARQVLQVLQG